MGCGGTAGQVTAETSGNNVSTESTTAEEAAPTSEKPAPPANPKFGETYTYEDGLALTISPPQPYTPSDSAAVGEPRPPSFVAFDIKIVNGAQLNYEPGMISLTMQSANVEEQKVFDSAKRNRQHPDHTNSSRQGERLKDCIWGDQSGRPRDAGVAELRA